MDFDNMIKLKDFAVERGVSVNTITQYIKSHPEIKEHTHYDTANKNTMYLDDKAVSMLSKKYRISTQIITDSDMYEQMMKTNGKVVELAELVMQMHQERSQMLMLETKNDDLIKRVEQLEAENAKLRENDEMHRLEAEKLRAEQNSMIDSSYIDIIRKIARLKREKQ